MRKFFIPLALILALIILPLGAFASEQSGIKVKINNQVLLLDVNPIIDSGRTLVPVRGIFECMGADVQWDPQTKSVLATRGDIVVKLQIDNENAYVNDQVVPLDVPAKIVNGRTMVPVRFISESFGALVGWDSMSSTVLIQDANAKTIDFEKLNNAIMSTRVSEFKFTIKETLTLMGQVINATVTGSGKINNDDMHFKETITAPQLGSPMSMELIAKDGNFYTKIGDKPWTATEIIQTSQGPMFISGEMFTAITNSPIKQEKNVLINGKATTKYTIKADEVMLSALINELFSASGLYSTNNTPSVSASNFLIIIYVDDKDQLVKEQVQADFNATIPDLQMNFKINATGDIDYFNIGKPINITAPAIDL